MNPNDFVHPMVKLGIKLTAADPGAAAFVSQLLSDSRHEILLLLDDYGLRGSDLHVLYSDICDCNSKKARHLVLFCPKDILVDACRRQDYSGKQLVERYMPTK